MTLIKICGVNDAAAFDTAVAAGADFVGFNFFPASPRYVTAAQAAALSSRHAGGPKRVGLFVAPEDDHIATVLAALSLDALQLYVPVEREAALRGRFGVSVWRAVGVAARADLPLDADGADRLLIDTKAPANASRPGGNAVAFDWSLLAGWTAPCPWLLAGGLTPENVATAIRTTGAPAVDVSSGVERAPGVKDAALIRAFIAAARAA
jgi:phosphoribosylanthranilate isomerase